MTKDTSKKKNKYIYCIASRKTTTTKWEKREQETHLLAHRMNHIRYVWRRKTASSARYGNDDTKYIMLSKVRTLYNHIKRNNSWMRKVKKLDFAPTIIYDDDDDHHHVLHTVSREFRKVHRLTIWKKMRNFRTSCVCVERDGGQLHIICTWNVYKR